MAVGYSRQSLANIVTGLVVEAAPINAEYDAVLAFCHATTGHNHDGTAGGGAPIDLVNSVKTTTKLPLAYGGTNATLVAASAYSTIIMNSTATALTYIKNNVAGTVAPAVTDDSNSGYTVGSMWYNTVAGTAYICVSPTVGAATWILVTGIAAIAAAIGNVKVTAADTTPAPLNTTLTVSSTLLTKTVVNAGADETLDLDVDIGQVVLNASVFGLDGAVKPEGVAAAVSSIDTGQAVLNASVFGLDGAVRPEVVAAAISNIDIGQIILSDSIFSL